MHGKTLAQPSSQPASQPAIQITPVALQAVKMSSQGFRDAILVSFGEPPSPQTSKKPTVFIGFHYVSQVPSGTTLDEFWTPKTPPNRPNGLQDEPKEPPRTPETSQMDQKASKWTPRSTQDPQSDPEGLHSIQIACRSDPKGFTSEPKKFKSELHRASKMTPRALKMTQQVLQETPTSQQRTTNLSSACR